MPYCQHLVKLKNILSLDLMSILSVIKLLQYILFQYILITLIRFVPFLIQGLYCEIYRLLIVGNTDTTCEHHWENLTDYSTGKNSCRLCRFPILYELHMSTNFCLWGTTFCFSNEKKYFGLLFCTFNFKVYGIRMYYNLDSWF